MCFGIVIDFVIEDKVCVFWPFRARGDAGEGYRPGDEWLSWSHPGLVKVIIVRHKEFVYEYDGEGAASGW